MKQTARPNTRRARVLSSCAAVRNGDLPLWQRRCGDGRSGPRVGPPRLRRVRREPLCASQMPTRSRRCRDLGRPISPQQQPGADRDATLMKLAERREWAWIRECVAMAPLPPTWTRRLMPRQAATSRRASAGTSLAFVSATPPARPRRRRCPGDDVQGRRRARRCANDEK